MMQSAKLKVSGMVLRENENHSEANIIMVAGKAAG